LLQANHPSARAALIQTGVTQSYADLRLDPSVGELDADRLFRDRALAYIQSDPVGAATTAGLKLLVSLTGFDFGSPPMGPRNVVAVVSSGVLGGLAVWGFALWRRRSEPSTASDAFVYLVVWVVGLVTTAMLVIGPVGLRYRVSFTMLWYLAAAFAIQRGLGAMPWSRAGRR
jgi:hypothetical protein